MFTIVPTLKLLKISGYDNYYYKNKLCFDKHCVKHVKVSKNNTVTEAKS